MHYGTKAQQQQWLPRLSAQEMPCFALQVLKRALMQVLYRLRYRNQRHVAGRRGHWSFIDLG